MELTSRTTHTLLCKQDCVCASVCVRVCRQQHIICVLFLISSQRKEKQSAPVSHCGRIYWEHVSSFLHISQASKSPWASSCWWLYHRRLPIPFTLSWRYLQMVQPDPPLCQLSVKKGPEFNERLSHKVAESKGEQIWNNRAAVIPVVTYSNNKVWRQEGEESVCMCVCWSQR